MDEFSFLSVLISVILGLAVAEILQGFRGLLWSRTRIQIYWPVIGWAFLVLLVCFEYWWSMFRMRTHHDWTFQQFAIMGLQTTLIYMVAGLVFPDFLGEAIVDLKESFYAHRRWFFSLAVAIIATSVCKHPPGWQAPKPNESRILRTLRCDTIHWRTDAPGVVS